ncbi:7749_t:CDS:2 [Funneliformis mosseae]|uniref:7749_t:CDS:1 n=1 Tax=Funneliformis mosseae TaxID=27381 RepID=A0A9N8ZF38_FUNMO|nr:7749_t:CDS:2 [Funneliformis mosseae]
MIDKRSEDKQVRYCTNLDIVEVQNTPLIFLALDDHTGPDLLMDRGLPSARRL